MARRKTAAKKKTDVQKAIDALDTKAVATAKKTTTTKAKTLKTPAKKSDTNSSEKQTTKASTSPTDAPTSKKANGKKATGWILLSLLLSAALGGLGWLFMQQKSAVDGLRIDMTASQTGMASLQADVSSQAATQAAVAAEKPEWVEQAALMQAQLATLTQADEQTVASLTAMSETNKAAQGAHVDARTEWAHAELSYLVKLANHRAALVQDASGAKTALTLADDRARALGEPGLFPLRSLLADEIQSLAAVAEVDIVGLSAKLQSAIKRVDNLQILIAPEVAESAPEASATDAAPEEGKWEKAAGEAWQALRSLVVIRHQTEGEKAVLAPEQRYFLYQNLRLKLDSAKLALLRGEQAIYTDSLQSANQWTQDYFAGAERDAMVQALTDLQAQKIAVALPDISGSLQWLNQRGKH